MESDAGRRREVAVWASHLAFEDCIFGKFKFVLHHMFDALVERLKMGVPGLVFVTGVQGVGKTCILMLACGKLRELGYGVNFLNLGSAGSRLVFEGWVRTGVPGGLVFVDLPDYPRSGARALNRDLDLLGRLYFSQGVKRRSTFVVSVQKELFRGHYLLGKGMRLEVPRIPPAELMGVYRGVFGDYEPFTEDSLRVVAEASRGVFRRFYRYIGFCLGGTRGLVGVEDVRRVLTVDVVMEDLGLELASFLRGDDPRRAVELLELLRVRGALNQKSIAGELGFSESSLSRLLVRLEEAGFVDRVRGDRKEMNVRLAPVEPLKGGRSASVTIGVK